MIVIDANLLLYAYDEVDPRHPVALRWFIDLMNGGDDVGLAVVTILAFLRISTNPRIYEQPRPVPKALEIVGAWLARPNVRILEPTSRHWSIFGDVVARGRARGPELMDAHLATLTIEHGATLATADRGFARFPGLRMVDPTAA
jgi:toxin-antitoxin system PIN domain toxin